MEASCKLQQKNAGNNIQGAARLHVSETGERREPGKIHGHAPGGEVEDHVDHVAGTQKIGEYPKSVESVGFAGKCARRT